jgi:hypothetical protein
VSTVLLGAGFVEWLGADDGVGVGAGLGSGVELADAVGVMAEIRPVAVGFAEVPQALTARAVAITTTRLLGVRTADVLY